MMRLKDVLYPVIGVCLLLCGGSSARAFTQSDANLAWQSYKNQFYYTTDANTGFFRNQQGVGNTATTYQLAYVIEAAVDARDTTAVTQSIKGFVDLYGTNPASWDVAEDDNMTFALVFAHAYQLTGNVNHLNMAKANFDTSYNRAWDAAHGGGLMRIVPGVKSAQVNGPGCLAAILIYQSGGGSAYLTKAQNIYNWMLANVWNSQTGQVNATPGDTSNPLSSDASYFAACAHYLGNDTNMNLAGNFVKNRWGTGMQGFGPGSFLGSVNSANLRWLAKSGFNTSFLQACVDRGWGCRNAAGLVGPDFNQPTTNAAQYAFDCTNIVAGMMTVPVGGLGGTPAGPPGYTWCANENQSFTFSQTVDVAYGGAGNFVYHNAVSGTITFNNAAFGDPAPGSSKAGFYRASGGSSSTLTQNNSLTSGQKLTNGTHSLVMQSDGNLVELNGATAIWASGTSGHSGSRATMQSDGNFVIYSSTNSALWASGTSGHAGAYLTLQSDGNVVVYSSTNSALWANGQAGR